MLYGRNSLDIILHCSATSKDDWISWQRALNAAIEGHFLVIMIQIFALTTIGQHRGAKIVYIQRSSCTARWFSSGWSWWWWFRNRVFAQRCCCESTCKHCPRRYWSINSLWLIMVDNGVLDFNKGAAGAMRWLRVFLYWMIDHWCCNCSLLNMHLLVRHV